jgi:hypothetical protein
MFGMEANLLLPDTEDRDVISRAVPELNGRLLLLDRQQVWVRNDDLLGWPALWLLLQRLQFLLVGETQQALAGPMAIEGVEFLLDFDESGLSEVLFVGKTTYLLLSQLPLMF